MKKAAILFLGLLFLLSGCMTISEGDMSSILGIEDLTLSAAGETGLDLSGFAAYLEAAQDGDARGARLYFTSDGQIYAQAALTVDASRAVLSLRKGAEEPESVYMTSEPDVVQALGQVMDALISEPLPDVENMTDEEIEAMVAQMQEEMAAALEELDPEALAELESMTEEDWQAQVGDVEEKTAEMQELFERCVRPGQPVAMEGTQFDTLDISVSNDDLVRLVDIWSGNEDFGQALRNTGCDISVTGTVYEGGGMGGLDLTADIVTPEDGTVSLAVRTGQFGDPDRDELAVSVSVDGTEAASLSVDFLSTVGGSADWLEPDVSDATDLTGMDGQEASRLVGDDCADFMAAAFSGVAGRLTGNMLAGALPW